MKPSPAFRGLVVALFVLVVSLVVLRSNHAGDDEEASLSQRLATGVVYAVLAVGPAFAGEILLKLLLPASLVARELQRSKKALAVETSKKRKAQKRIKEIHDEFMAYQSWVTRIQGRYYKIWAPARTAAGHTGPALPAVDPSP